jgi:hypothetical protein
MPPSMMGRVAFVNRRRNNEPTEAFKLSYKLC